MRVLAISGSLRQASNSTALLRALAEEAPEGVEVELWHGLREIPPYDADEVTRLILDTHDRAAFAPIASMTVGEFRDWLLSYEADAATISAV